MAQEVDYSTETPSENYTNAAFHQLLELFPEAFERRTPDEVSMSLDGNAFRKEAVEDQDVSHFLESYGLEWTKIETLPDGNIRLPVTSHFDESTRIPKSYAYKGGAARALLLRSLGRNMRYKPRDIDLIRLSPEASYPEEDHALSLKFMKDDYEFGDGVEPIKSTEEYLATRDFTINELYATDSEIIATPQCIKDTIRGIIKLTDYERNEFNGLGNKMLSKMLRLYSEGIVENMPLMLTDVIVGELEESFISPFWLAVQLDRAFQKGRSYAEEFVNILKNHRQIPVDINNSSEAADYLLDLLGNDNFYFRYSQKSQFDLEEQLIDDYYGRYETLASSYSTFPKFRGHGRSRGNQ